jgi:tetratricopeptide (TPR) repeat protein
LPLFVRGLAAAFSGSTEAEKNLAGLKAIVPANALAGGVLGMREFEIAAVAAARKQDYVNAIELMKKATALEEGTGSPSGPPALIKPSHELFGEILLQAGRPAEAAEQFRTALLRQPNRARSLLGIARAAAKSGKQGEAAAAYNKLLSQWAQADAGLPELREAQEYLKQAGTSHSDRASAQ